MPEKIYPEIDMKDEGLRKQILARFEECKTYYGDWRKEAEEDYHFALGSQWTDEEKEKLRQQNRPCLTFNRIRPLINVISGYQRENAARIKVSPEGGEDKIFSEVFDKALSATDKWSKLSYSLGYLFDDGLYCGKGFIEALLDYTKDPIRGELKWILLGPTTVFVDPACNDYDINEGAEYLFKIGKFTKSKLKRMYPSKASLISGFKDDTDNYIDNYNVILDEDSEDDYGSETPSKVQTASTPVGIDYGPDQKFTHKEYWYKKYVKKYFVLDPESKEPKRFDTNQEAQAFIVQTGGGDRKIFEREMPEIWVVAMVAGHVLQDVKSPFEPYYSGYPIFRFIADWAPSAKTEVEKVQGIVRSLKDAQREKNKSKSQFLHILNTQANSGWIGDDNALTPEGWKALEAIGSSPGIVVKKKPGSVLEEIQPKARRWRRLYEEKARMRNLSRYLISTPTSWDFRKKPPLAAP